MVLLQVADQLAHLHDLARIEAHRRLVEDEDHRAVDESRREADPLPVAFREVPDRLFGDVRDEAGLERLADARRGVAARNAAEARPVRDVLADPHLRVERERLGEVAEMALGLERPGEDVDAGQGDPSRRRREEPRDHPHRGRLPGSVRAEEAEDLAILDAEADIVDGRCPEKRLRETLDFEHRMLGAARALDLRIRSAPRTRSEYSRRRVK